MFKEIVSAPGQFEVLQQTARCYDVCPDDPQLKEGDLLRITPAQAAGDAARLNVDQTPVFAVVNEKTEPGAYGYPEGFVGLGLTKIESGPLSYVASRASIAERPAMWRRLRETPGIKINSTWIDEAGPGQTVSNDDLWTRIKGEVKAAKRIVVFIEPDDFPLKGVFLEIGMAIAFDLEIVVVAPNVEVDRATLRPIGSWIEYSKVFLADTVEEALLLPAESFRQFERTTQEERAAA